MLVIAALICGLIFGWGLLISEMVQPAKVLAFLDIFGAWDPSLAVVMIAALVVSVPGFRLAKRRERPILATQSVWPAKMGIDRPLMIGSALEREESRGTHYRRDFPEREDRHWQRHLACPGRERPG